MIRLLTQSDKEKIMDYIGRNELETSFLYANVIEFGIDNNPDMRRCGDYYGFFEGEELRGILLSIIWEAVYLIMKGLKQCLSLQRL